MLIAFWLIYSLVSFLNERTVSLETDALVKVIPQGLA
jgi:hypothetical protein